MGDMVLALPDKEGIGISFRMDEDDFNHITISYKDLAEDFLDSLMSPLSKMDSGEIVVGIKPDDAEAAQQVKDVITSFRYLADWLEQEYGKQVVGTYNLEKSKLYLGH
jgi:hypothetical protein